MDNNDLRNLHVVRGEKSDEIYVSFPKEPLNFLGWCPDSQLFLFSMPPVNEPASSGSNVYYADQANVVSPLLVEQVSTNAAANIMVSNVNRVNGGLYLIYNKGCGRSNSRKMGS